MTAISHRARITGPVSYTTSEGKVHEIPVGPCMVEQVGARAAEIVWGSKGENSAALSVDEVKVAADLGNLLVPD